MIHAVLPFRVSNDGRLAHYADNAIRAGMLLQSMVRYLGSPIHITVPARADEMAQFPVCRAPHIRVDVIDEETLVPGIGASPAEGWYRQQVLKLAYAAQCPAEFCLCLDPDMFLTQPMTEADLIRDGRGTVAWRQKRRIEKFWQHSADVLSMACNFDEMSLGNTPQTLHRDTVADMLAHLAKRGTDLAGLLALKGWTELAIYSIYAENTGRLRQIHAAHPAVPLIGWSLWFPWERYGRMPYEIRPESGFFTVLQSRNKPPMAEVTRMFWKAMRAGERATARAGDRVAA